uniref:Uncharacterized protein n=1 Tax=Eubacterium cellulosolvens (strain ATCC 43171 / JCM 9499 / 6) TaxID=633697 RepID=I5AXV2_EUBC6
MQENREPTDKSKKIKQIIILYCFEEEIKAGNYQNILFFSEQLLHGKRSHGSFRYAG